MFTTRFKQLKLFLLKALSSKSSRLPILFVHMPKAAGTSFRTAALESKRIKSVLCDYDEKNPITSKVLKDLFKLDNYQDELAKLLSEKDDYLLSGHFKPDKYLPYFYPYQTIIFVRDPVDRIVSEYHHKVRKDKYSGEISEFVETPKFRQIQKSQFGKLPPGYFGFVGVFEQYEQSLDAINALYEVDIKPLHRNENPEKLNESKYQIAPSLRESILKLNRYDVALYEQCKSILDYRLAHIKQKNNWLYGGWTMEGRSIRGRVFKAFATEPVSLDLYIDGSCVASTIANQYNPITCVSTRQPLDGNIGFRFDITDGQVISTDSEIKIVCSTSGQMLFRE